MDRFVQLFCVVFVSVLALTRGECPDNYLEGPNRHCYSYQYSSSSSGIYWASARSYCALTNDSDLVVLDDETEYEWFVNLTSTVAPNSSWWLGYHDSSVEGDWRWVDCGETTDWHRTLWSPGYPGNERDDCGVLLPSGEIDDVVCDVPINYFLCEVTPKGFTPDEARPTNLIAEVTSTLTVTLKWDVSPFYCDVFGYRIQVTNEQMETTQEMVYGGKTSEVEISLDRVRAQYSFTVAALTILDEELAVIGPVVATTGSCPDSYEESPGGRCYLFRNLTNGEWWPAGRRSCDNTVDGDLVIINDEEELNYIMNRTSEIDPDGKWWIGLSDLAADDDWQWVDCTESNDWQNRLWAPGYPSCDDTQDCAILNPDGTIQDDVCDLRINSICEISPKEFNEEALMVGNLMVSASLPTSLEVSWSLPVYGCSAVGYRIYYSMADSMEDKESMFVQGGDATHAVVQDLRANTTYNVTVAIYNNKDDELEESQAVEGTTMPCPADYEEGPNGHCYWFAVTTYGYMWYWGRQDCSEEPDSDLVIINDEEELDFLRNRTAELAEDRDWWIGLSSSPAWSWTDCEETNPWQDTLWAPGNPRPESYGCAVLDDSGEVVDKGCDIKHHFICEIYPRGFSAEDENVEDIKASPLMYGMEVSWTLAPKHCNVEGYQIIYREDVEEAREFFDLQYGEDSSSTTVTGLYPNRTYNVSVAALLNTDVLLSPVGPVQITTPACPDDYEEGPNGHCYRFRFLDNGTRWMRGRQTCDNVDDSDYVIINDEEELNFLLNRSAEVDPEMNWWIGLSDLSMPGSWGWVDCSTPTAGQEGLWAPDYPTGQLSRCAALRPDGQVVDLPCETRLSYLCELLPKGFDSDALMVYNVTAQGYSNYIAVSWVLPENNCDAIGYLIYFQMSDGTGDRKSVFVSGGESTSGAITALPLGASYSMTVAVSTSKEMELQETAPVNASTVSSCPDNYEEGPNGGCYRFRLEDVGTWWTYRRQGCVFDVDYSDLLVINDQEEFDFVMNRTAEMSTDASWWIGYTDQSVEGDWKWMDTCEESTAFQGSLWAPDAPSIGAHDCAALQPTGDVIDLVCDALIRGFVCEVASREFNWGDANVQELMATGITVGLEVTWTVSLTSCDVVGYKITYQLDEPGSQTEFMLVYGGDVDSVTISGLLPERRYTVDVGVILNLDAELDPVTTVGTTLTCPNNYEEGPNGHCYRFRILDDGSHWPTGRRTCDNVEDSDLAVINDPEELAFLVNRSAEVNPDMTWWIGLSDLYIEGEWRWVDCSTTTGYQDTLWAPDYPSDVGLSCAALQPSGDIINLPCDRRFSYLCELNPKGFDLNSQVVDNVRASGGMYTIDVTWDLPENGCDAVGYKIYYELTGVESDVLRSVFVSGGDSVSGSVTGLLANASYDIKVAILTSKDTELGDTEPVTVSTVPCPDGYEEGPNGRCYRFRILDLGSWWPTGRRTCDNEPDSDLAIINDQVELDFLINRTAEIDPNIMWWIGYSDQSVEGDWRWVDCTESSFWQDALWVPGHPGNGRLDCAALQPDGQVVDLVCDTPLSYLCEISPRGFSQEDANPHNLAAMGTTYGLEVTWTVSPTSCDVIGYRISYYLTGAISTSGSTFVYGGDTSSAVVHGLATNTTYDVTVAAHISKDIELSPISPVTATTDPCPDDYSLAPNGRCYLFVQNVPGSFWHYSRETCWAQKDSDLAIINDQDELDFIVEQIAAIGDTKNWWLGYSDNSVEGEWRWVDCTESNNWQMNLWASGSPGNEMPDCGSLSSSGEVEAQVCDVPLNYVCEVSPKGFDPMELKVENLETSGASYGVDVSWTLPENNCDAFGYKIYYQEMDSDMEEFKIIYGGDSIGARVAGLLPNTTLDVSVAVLIVDDELERVGPLVGISDPCPTGYEEAANGRCYWFQDSDRYVKDWLNARYYCSEAAGNFDHDLMIIDDEWELEYITNRTREFNDGKDWRIGYSDLAEEGVWKWVTCESPDAWQQSLWAPGYPQNGLDDCGVFDPDNMTIYDQVCDVGDINFICEVTPKDFRVGDDNVFNLNATAIGWDTIRVTWNVSEYNCDVIAYNIYYLDTFLGGQPEWALVYGGEVDSYDITMVQPSTRYSISVSAERQEVELPQVGPVYVTTPEGPCSAYYETGPNGGCYRFVTSQYGSIWTSGRGGCSSVEDSDLVVIDNQMELDFIVNRTKDFNPIRDWWVGFSDFSVESDWRWVTCEAPTDWQNTIWETGYPRNGLHDCGALSSGSRQVVDAVCDTPNYYICEITPKGFTDADMNVREVMASPISSTEVHVTWMLSNVTCNVYGYKIYYGMQGEPFDKTQFHLVYGGDITSLTVSELTPSMAYEFHVAALVPDRLELPKIGPANATTYSECGRTTVDKDGMIMNADYPNGYAGPETCEWLVSAPSDQYVLLQILDFDTRAGADFVVIGSGLDFSTETTLYVLSGSKANAGTTPIPAKVLSPGQHLWISFKTSEATLDHAGFQMAVTMVTQGPGIPERQYEEITEEGTLTSPGWPDNHPNLVDLTWTLIAPKTGRVRITSLEGFLESDYDTLTIGYGNPDSSVLGSYTGDFKLDETLESPTYNFWVRFQADETVSNKGFTLNWESFDDQESCGTQELLEGSGTVMSPNYPQPYPDNQECTWYIRLPSMNNLVRIEFTAFSLEVDHDTLVVGTGKTINEEVIAILTGDSLPAPIDSASYRMWLQFKSDESFSSMGFSLEYSSIDNPEPPTPYNEITDSVVFIVEGEPVGWFTPARQQDLATGIATSMTDYCMDRSDTCEEMASVRRRRDAGILQLTFSAEDVEFLDTVAVEDDLHITMWVGNPSMVDEDIILGIEPEIVQTSLTEETSQATIEEIMGEGFAYSVTPNALTPTKGPTDPPPQGLEPWAISLIVVASFAVVLAAVVGLEVRHRRKKGKLQTADGLMGSQELQTKRYEEPDYAVPLSRSDRSADVASGQENDGFEDGDNTQF